MEWTSLNDLREKYLSFFESKGHLRLKSFPLIPQGDKSLLLINSGMAPMKKYFTGEVTPPRKRVTTCQKCIRTPDIERVGKTARHGTYFEMLGNFSFGDYFKHEATAWAWEFCTKVMEMPVDKLWVTVYEDDDEAVEIWTKEVGVAPDRIVRMGKEDNFWEHGTGPCGPCSEIYFDRGPEHGCGVPDCHVGCECDRFVEFWNLVFTQFDSDGKGNYGRLEHPNIDTGMGLERLACICQGVDNLFEVDTVQNIMKHISRIAGVDYKTDEKKDVSLRVITDHIRSTVFMIGDGVMPSNEGRGYVLRRLLRRAARHGRLLGINKPFLSEVAETVIRENEGAYPELREKQDLIKKLIHVEEESFGRTIDQGLQMLSDIMDRHETDMISGENAFKLYDTYGFPLDLTKDILEERGMTVDEDTFLRLMDEQKKRAREARKGADKEAWKGDGNLLEGVAPTFFTGYNENENDAVILAIIDKDGNRVDTITAGAYAVIMLDKTPFYAESGGQVADAGLLTGPGDCFEVQAVGKTPAGVFTHSGQLLEGMLSVGDKVHAAIDVQRRMAIRRNHTAAHLLQAALRKVLGTHVEQAGQLVNDQAVRFDFTHFSALTDEELEAVEKQVNDVILAGIPVVNEEMPIEQAKAMGAMALFGEKYGDVVRVVSVKDASVEAQASNDGLLASIELCGGTHIDNTAKIGLFRIVSESSVASGVRRIEAVTGQGVLDLLSQYKTLTQQAARAFKIGNPEELVFKAQQVMNEVKEKDKEIERLRGKLAAMQMDGLFSEAKEVEGLKVISAAFTGTGADAVRAMCDKVKEQLPMGVCVIAGMTDGKVTFGAACGAEAVKKGAHAGNLVREVAKMTGGNGGGRPDSAMAGGKDASKVDDAIAAVPELLEKLLQSKK